MQQLQFGYSQVQVMQVWKQTMILSINKIKLILFANVLEGGLAMAIME
jgi:hypothetical protein